jgi:hypothetical protein
MMDSMEMARMSRRRTRAGEVLPRAESRALERQRSSALADRSDPLHRRVEAYCQLAATGLERMYLGEGRFPFTKRRIGGARGHVTHLEGDSLRYAAIAALGLGNLPETAQRRVLGGGSAAELALTCAGRAATDADMGAIALSAWAAAEVAGVPRPELFATLGGLLAAGPVETVSCAWALSAGLAAATLADTGEVRELASRRLLAGQAKSGLFPHLLPPGAGGWARAQIGCFADQVYPIQALARLAAAEGDSPALAAAADCAARIVALQGAAGQWWWHYDVRDGSVAEGYPVYSVHQHGMGPMCLLDLAEAGGPDHWPAISRSLGWLDAHPETGLPLVDEREAVIWRKVGRREPAKAVRKLAAVTTALRPGLHLPGLGLAFPPGPIDYECRPYELGWLLYAWRYGGVTAADG